MAFVPIAFAAVAGATAAYYWIRSGGKSTITVTQLQQLATLRRQSLLLALEDAFNQSSAESRQVTEEYAALLASTEFSNAFQVFQACVSKDFSTAASSSLAFRGNTFGTRLAMELLRAYGKEYATALATPLFDLARKWTDAEAMSYELAEYKIDAEQLGGKPMQQHIEEAQIKFRSLCESVLDVVCNTPVPERFKFLLKWAQELADEKIRDGKFDAISGMLTLRFVIPALVSANGLTAAQSRPLMRACQALQALTVGTTLSNKEQYMAFLDTFFSSNAARYEDWRQEVISTEVKTLQELETTLSPVAPPTECPRLLEFVTTNAELLAATKQFKS